VADLALTDQITHCSGYVLNRDIRVHAVLVEEVDVVCPQALERRLRYLSDMLGAAVHTAAADPKAELRGDDDLITHRGKRLANKLFVGEQAIHLRGIEEVTPRSTAERTSAIISLRSGGWPSDEVSPSFMLRYCVSSRAF
jgi:hypothetical protein